MYRLIEDCWSIEKHFSTVNFKEVDMQVAWDDERGIEFRLEHDDDLYYPYVITCELCNGFTRDSCFNNMQEVIEWIIEVSEDLDVDYEGFFFEEIPDDETEDDNQDYSLFTRKELRGF